VLKSLTLFLLLLFPSLVLGRTYHKYTIEQITAENPSDWKHPLTHIEVSGVVLYVVKEDDNDLHVRICTDDSVVGMDAKRCIVAEIIPTLIPKGFFKPKKGQRIVVRGIYRYDGENPGHHWHEVHPVEEMRIADGY
jgi:hypothetical protein